MVIERMVTPSRALLESPHCLIKMIDERIIKRIDRFPRLKKRIGIL